MAIPYRTHQPYINLEDQKPYGAPPSKTFAVDPGYYPVAPLEHVEQLYQRDSTLKRSIRIFRVVSRILTFLLAIYTTYTQAETLAKYLSTRGIIIGSRNAWAHDTKLWPTVLLLSTSAVTLLISLVTITAYYFSIRHANNASNTVGTFSSWLEFGAHLAVWIATSAAYRAGKDGNDLWGWTCSDKADAIQGTFVAVVDFNRFCNSQTNSWYVSIAQVGLVVITLTVYALAWRRASHKGKMAQQAQLLQQGRMG